MGTAIMQVRPSMEQDGLQTLATSSSLEGRLESRLMQSEYYHLRRTAIKDLSAYCGFLLGFLGSAPLAWELLAGQLDAGNFAKGLWYFFGMVTGAGIFSGIAGMGIGFVIGLTWEQFHRYRRRIRGRKKADMDLRAPTHETMAPDRSSSASPSIAPSAQES